MVFLCDKQPDHLSGTETGQLWCAHTKKLLIAALISLQLINSPQLHLKFPQIPLHNVGFLFLTTTIGETLQCMLPFLFLQLFPVSLLTPADKPWARSPLH